MAGKATEAHFSDQNECLAQSLGTFQLNIKVKYKVYLAANKINNATGQVLNSDPKIKHLHANLSVYRG